MVQLLGELFAIEADFEPDPERQRAGLDRLLASPGACVLVAETRVEVIGMCSVQTLVSTAEGGEAGLVEDLIVAEAFRRRGIGTRLMEEAECWARERGIERLQLLAETGNERALDFYRRNGWAKTGLGVLRKRVELARD